MMINKIGATMFSPVNFGKKGEWKRVSYDFCSPHPDSAGNAPDYSHSVFCYYPYKNEPEHEIKKQLEHYPEYHSGNDIFDGVHIWTHRGQRLPYDGNEVKFVDGIKPKE